MRNNWNRVWMTTISLHNLNWLTRHSKLNLSKQWITMHQPILIRWYYQHQLVYKKRKSLNIWGRRNFRLSVERHPCHEGPPRIPSSLTYVVQVPAAKAKHKRVRWLFIRQFQTNSSGRIPLNQLHQLLNSIRSKMLKTSKSMGIKRSTSYN